MTIITEEHTERTRREKYFLPYQTRYLQDPSRFKIVEKSRRIGFTFVQAYEDVRDCVRTKGYPVWFSSADESAAKEFILYCEQWAKVFDVVAKNLGEQVIDEKNGAKALVLELLSGSRIHAMRSNPKGFRSKGGKVVLDEFAWHDDQDALWKASRPTITWGYPIRILSTHNGKGCRYFRTLDDAKTKLAQGRTVPWSVHTVDIFQAVADGLADKILKRPLTESERQAWIEEQRETCLDEETWQQEFCCIPVDEATAFLTYDLIATVEDALAGDPSLYAGGDAYVGIDIGRRRDLFVIWVLERVGDVLWTREVVALKGASFAAQDAEMDRVMRSYTVRRVCMDQTGMGEKPVEDAQARHGAYLVEGLVFTGAVKQDLANGLKRVFEDRQFRAPKNSDVRDDFHAVKKITTVAGNVRFDAERTEQGHADRMWSAALAVHAASDAGPPAAAASSDAESADWRERRSGMLVAPGARERLGFGWGGKGEL